jgi:hypothetical protein
MKQVTNIHAKKYVAPAVETFKMEQEAIMSTSANDGNTTEKVTTRQTIDRRRSYDE